MPVSITTIVGGGVALALEIVPNKIEIVDNNINSFFIRFLCYTDLYYINN
jgi:hypothetical protein